MLLFIIIIVDVVEGERDRQTNRHRQTDRHKYRDRDTDRDRQTETQIEH